MDYYFATLLSIYVFGIGVAGYFYFDNLLFRKLSVWAGVPLYCLWVAAAWVASNMVLCSLVIELSTPFACFGVNYNSGSN